MVGRRRLVLPVAAVLVAALAACGGTDAGGEGAGGDAPAVVVTTSILGDLAGEVLADTGAQVAVLMPPGADPHGYEPSAADGVALREADLVVAVGLGLEESLEDTIEAAEQDGVEVLRVGELVDPVERHGGQDEHGDEQDEADTTDEADDDHHHGERPDPHVWLDPARAGGMAEAIAAAYAEVAPDDGVAATDAAAAYVERMAVLDDEIATTLDVLPPDRRQLITNHDALGYFADRYDLDVVATVLPGTSADVDVTAESFTDLVELLRDTGLPAVFAETTSSDRLARALAAEVDGVEVVELYTGALGEPGSGADSLEGMLRTDAQRIADALG